jgi:periplasmic divalent cation tolerance protein
MNESEFVFLYSTFPDSKTAAKAGEMLVARGLAACVNIHPPMTSIYRWEGKLEAAQEVAAFVKTRRALVTQAIQAMRPLHPYAVPCFLLLPIERGNEDYLAWARVQTTMA